MGKRKKVEDSSGWEVYFWPALMLISVCIAMWIASISNPSAKYTIRDAYTAYETDSYTQTGDCITFSDANHTQVTLCGTYSLETNQ